MDRAQQFRDAAERHNGDRGRTGWRYPPEIRTLAVEHCQEQRQDRRAYSEIAVELGITVTSLSRWLEESSTGDFLPVQVVEPVDATQTAEESPRAQGTLSAVTPCGLRIEGLAWPQVFDLVRLFG